MTRALSVMLRSRLAFLVAANLAAAAVMAQLSPFFLDVGNLLEMTRYGAVLGLLALGQTLVIVCGKGDIDLSVGSVLSLTGVFFGTLVVSLGVPTPLAAVAAVGLGLLLGSLNGVLTAVLGMPPIIVTLGALYAYGSLALVWTDGTPISGFPDSFGFVGQKTVLGVPAQVLLVLIPIALVLGYVVNFTVFGRSIFFVGINEAAAALSGINVARTRIAVYAISGALAAVGAVVTASWLMSARPDAGLDYELRAITVAVLGGTAIMGGEGSLAGTLLAVLIVTMIASGLELAGFNAIWQLAVLGGLLLTAVLLNEFVFGRFSRAGT
jgi:ribose/xylose/arabinose/galactoside ABC-type transport system permease subunit